MKVILKLFGKDSDLSVLSVITVCTFVVLILILGDKFFSLNNLQSLAYQIPEFGFLALAMMLAMLTGGIDLSIVTNACLSGIIGAYFLTGAVFPLNSPAATSAAIVIAVITILAISIICGTLNGILIAKFSVPPILATLGTMILFSGIGMAITSGKGVVGFPEAFMKFGSGSVLNIPYIFILFVLAVIVMSILLSRTRFGKKIYLFGENFTALRFTGVNTERLIIAVYTIAGFLAGFAGIIIISRVNSARVGYGDTYLLQAILVAVLGGVDPYGGRGRIAGVMLGMCILQILQSAFTLFSFTPYTKRLVWGFILLLVMIINFIIEKRRTSAPKAAIKA